MKKNIIIDRPISYIFGIAIFLLACCFEILLIIIGGEIRADCEKFFYLFGLLGIFLYLSGISAKGWQLIKKSFEGEF